MKRRALLALTSTVIAGCAAGSNSSSNLGGKNYTAPSDVDVHDETKDIPDPPRSVTRESAREFVETYEENRIYNELLGENMSEEHEGYVGTADDRDVVELEIEPIEIDLLRETDHGYYFITSISGEAEHWCSYDPPMNETRSCSGGGSRRNSNAVVHFVDSDFHLRIPYNWYTCTGPAEPYASSTESENIPVAKYDSAAQLQVYNVTGDEHEIELTVRFVDGSVSEEVYSTSVGTPPYLAVISDLANRRGTYEVEATLDSGYTEQFEWDLLSDSVPSWTGTSIFITPTEELWVDTLDPESGIEIPSRSCRDRPEDRSDENDGEG